MKRSLIILSDLWGNTNNEWITEYINALKDRFSIKFYDCQDLAQIDKSMVEEGTIYKQFIDGGIDRAVANLLTAEQERVSILAFSVGGAIAWKAALSGLKVDTLFALSSTRLRHETEQPKCDLMLYLGENDEYKPGQKWFDQQEIIPFIFDGMGHDMYMDSTLASRICDHIILSLNSND